ncbi:MAG: hypothetical protein LUC50_01270 [Ruminococcus sp.]|nr:hypothetical protein [Ruminococcus sp.]
MITLQHITRRTATAVTAVTLAAACLPTVAVSSAPYNTWTGYVLRGADDQYLSISG